jgi:hypothetical protein
MKPQSESFSQPNSFINFVTRALQGIPVQAGTTKENYAKLSVLRWRRWREALEVVVVGIASRAIRSGAFGKHALH